MPITEVILKISILLEKLYAIKFQGKPVKIDPLINSITPNINEKRKKALKFFLGFNIINKYATKA